MSDRIFGSVVVIVALAYIASATQIETSFLTDPLGPKVFPILIGAAAAVCGLTIMLRPDPPPGWSGAPGWLRLTITLVVLIGYAYALKPGGFMIPTALAAGIISYQIMGRAGHAAVTGAALAAGLFVVFKFGLGLGLVALPKL